MNDYLISGVVLSVFWAFVMLAGAALLEEELEHDPRKAQWVFIALVATPLVFVAWPLVLAFGLCAFVFALIYVFGSIGMDLWKMTKWGKSDG